ncbi:hypothetical protein [Ureaplasma canigenitalium]|uniref:hypothetical protein n=1 Tax=Ureaplasma canigenitalium TaxID=42092 RepID=UPI0004E21AD5|nr:hypothetical protein [Ureaplasma canigenitalium]
MHHRKQLFSNYYQSIKGLDFYYQRNKFYIAQYNELFKKIKPILYLDHDLINEAIHIEDSYINYVWPENLVILDLMNKISNYKVTELETMVDAFNDIEKNEELKDHELYSVIENEVDVVKKGIEVYRKKPTNLILFDDYQIKQEITYDKEKTSITMKAIQVKEKINKKGFYAILSFIFLTFGIGIIVLGLFIGGVI